MIGWLEHPLLKWLLPVPILLAVAPVVFWFFRPTWRAAEAEALSLRQQLSSEGRFDYRPIVTLVLGVLILTMQEYYGKLSFYSQRIEPLLVSMLGGPGDPGARAYVAYYNELFGRLWWALTRVGGYVVPFIVWCFAFRTDRLRDMGLSARGLLTHAWIYALFVVVMVPILLLVSRQPDFGAYYPICATAGRSWAEFLAWEVAYLAQFVGLEMFFRGWWIRTTRIFGVGAIFAMVVPYTMIHFGKPYLEACSAIIAGTVLGSLALMTRSIWSGVAVHSTVAVLMDILALDHKGQLPVMLTATSRYRLVFHHWRAVIWLAWVAALAVLVVNIVRAWPRFRAWRRTRRAAPG